MPLPYEFFRPLSLAAVAAMLVVLTGCEADGAAQVVEHKAAVTVRAAPVVAATAAEPLRFAGVVRARQRAQLTFQVGGVLRSRSVEIGQAVEQGAILATLYNPELEPARNVSRARLEELKAQAAQAEREAQRSDQLFERGVISAQQREQQQARLDALQAGVGSARAALIQTEQVRGESQLRAPFAGRIETLMVEPGEFVSPGQPVMALASAEGLEVEVLIPGDMLQGLSIGQHVPLWDGLHNTPMQGTISEIGQGSSQGSALYPLVVALEQDAARSGDAVEVGIGRAAEQGLNVPMAAVMRSFAGGDGGLAVFRVTAGKVERVSIEVEALRGEWAMLRGNALQAGDMVVYAGLTRLSEGDAVELLP
jgi:RND family efflux transporter MFP subunit